MTALLSIDRLRTGYGQGPVITSLSLAIKRGSLIGIVGPNGRGKTSLLRAISGLMPQQKGSITFDGQQIAGMAPDRITRRGIVHVPQGDLVYRQMSVLENLLVGGHVNRSKAVSVARLDWVFALFPKLRERQEQMASSLSGGERRMLGVGRGLMMSDARLIMLDEPSLGLAPIVIDQIYAALRQLRSSGLTIMVVEENVGRISTIADHLYLLDRGSFVWDGTPADMKSNSKLIHTYLGA
jgi:branched-chain amino acid transport system ATP-binding protein